MELILFDLTYIISKLSQIKHAYFGGEGKKDESTPFSHFKLIILQLSHCSQNFGGEKHHVLM
jgi:hypothetical protein